MRKTLNKFVYATIFLFNELLRCIMGVFYDPPVHFVTQRFCPQERFSCATDMPACLTEF